MADRTWRGGKGDWYDASKWATTPSDAKSYPLPGDAAAIASGEVELIGSEAKDNGSFDANNVTLGSAGGPTATLSVEDAILNHNFTIKAAGSATIKAVGRSIVEGGITDDVAGSTLTLESTPDSSGACALVLDHGASLTLSGTTTLDLEGIITVEGGAGFTAPATVSVVNDATVTQIGCANDIKGSLTGTGEWNLEFSTSLLLEASVASGQTMEFGDVDGRLRIADLQDFAGTVEGFSPGNLIDFTKITADGASYDATHHRLTLTEGLTTVATLNNVFASSGTLAAKSDGGSGTVISYAGTGTRDSYEIAGADDAMRSNVVRATMTVPGTTTPITGAGIKIGIISDSFDETSPGSANADAQAGYLPKNPDGTSAVTVLKEGEAGSEDEGRAMAELIHQVAPGAQLYFSTDGDTQTDMAHAVTALQDAGCNIIVDDITFLESPMYQVSGVLDTAVDNALSAGVDYFTSAGNFGDAFLEQSFDAANETLYDGTKVEAHIFSNDSPYETLTVRAEAQVQIDVQATEAYEGVGNTGASDELTFKLFDSKGSLVGTSSQDIEEAGTSDNYLDIDKRADAATYQLAVYLNNNEIQPSGFKIVVSSYGNGSGPGAVIDDPEAASGSGDLRGQQLIPGVNTVGAAFFGDSAAFGQQPDPAEYFSDSGPGKILFDGNGVPLSTPQNGGKVEFVAPDGVNTTVPGFSGFFGTSAAAPDAAAVAALMLQAKPSLTTAQVTTLLEQSALPLSEPAAVQGAGLIQADRAVALAELACYCRGTLIATSSGEKAVETLAIGDRLLTVSGEHRPIRWIGRRGYSGRFTDGNASVLPICFTTGSLDQNIPHRDLWVSPKHAMFLDGMLIPAEHLVNGVSICQAESVDVVEYFHIELDSHDVIMAEGALSETFVDDRSRGMFHNAHEFAALYPGAEPVEAVYCAPRIEEGFTLEVVRRRLAARAGLQVPADPVAGALRGWIEDVDEGRIVGWAQNEGYPDVPVCLDVLVDGAVVAQVLAGTFRSDLLAAGIGGGCHAFAVQLATAPSGEIAVRRSADHAELHWLPEAVALTRAA